MSNSVSEKRRFYRHPLEIPIQINELRSTKPVMNHTENISEGGLCFFIDRPVSKGTYIQVAIPIHDQLFKMKAEVAYSLKDAKTGLFQTGVAFQDAKTVFRAKLAEEILRIKKYHEALSQKNGAPLSEQEAANRWIQKNAKRFASLFAH